MEGRNVLGEWGSSGRTTSARTRRRRSDGRRTRGRSETPSTTTRPSDDLERLSVDPTTSKAAGGTAASEGTTTSSQSTTGSPTSTSSAARIPHRRRSSPTSPTKSLRARGTQLLPSANRASTPKGPKSSSGGGGPSAVVPRCEIRSLEEGGGGGESVVDHGASPRFASTTSWSMGPC